MKKQFTLGKEERLKSRKQIDHLFREGRSFNFFPFRVLFSISARQPDKTSVIQFGIGVSTRHFKKAVDRNRIKRLSREAWRLQKNELTELLSTKQKGLNAFFVFTGKELVEFAEVSEKMTGCIQKLKKFIDEDIDPHT